MIISLKQEPCPHTSPWSLGINSKGKGFQEVHKMVYKIIQGKGCKRVQSTPAVWAWLQAAQRFGLNNDSVVSYLKVTLKRGEVVIDNLNKKNLQRSISLLYEHDCHSGPKSRDLDPSFVGVPEVHHSNTQAHWDLPLVCGESLIASDYTWLLLSAVFVLNGTHVTGEAIMEREAA